ncbi:MAG: 2,3-bisphosphoglycerate-independent phosphoglycerate mutase [Rhodospirillaceae bacterium]|nr:2,3-bisphosphoglycerate-independent phosphoglycerate mutase [Rhodospirillaceae bacterium]
MSSDSKKTGRKPVVLCILDGWGTRREKTGNAIYAAETPNWDRLMKTYPHGKLRASALDVGLPDGQMGNSEVGHMTLGAGRVVMQDLPRIDEAIHDGSLDENRELLAFIADLKKSGGVCHLMGLLSPGGVHSHHWHMRTLAAIVAQAGIEVKVHAFLDGRDTPPKSAANFVKRFSVECRRLPGVEIATIMGRFWAMDRDQRWDRVEKAYQTLVAGAGTPAATAADAIATSYKAAITDEFVEPTPIGDYAGMKDGDGILMANFRSDRAREILGALGDPGFTGFKRSKVIKFGARLGMVVYSDSLKAHFAAMFPPVELDDILPELISKAGMKQLHIAETEKYAHVTFFFNGGREKPFKGEERILVPSPKVATYDEKPEMSAGEVTDKLIAAIEKDDFDFIVVNYANGDMVGHTGVIDAAVLAVQAVDACVGRLESAVVKAGGVMLITADHGNCEKMCHAGQPHTAHTLNLVPSILLGADSSVNKIADGALGDVAPTILQLLGLPKPDAMSGNSILPTAEGGN